MLKVVTGKEMNGIDQYTIQQVGISSMVLMERAALSVVQEVLKRPKIRNEKVLVLCGTGNNGGDGLAIARILYIEGVNVQTILIGAKEHLSLEAMEQYSIAKRIGVPIASFLESNLSSLIKESSVVVDGIFGTGLSREIQGEYATAIEAVNNGDCFVLSVDIPSGIDSKSGQVLGIAIKANMTITFGLLKLGLLLHPGTLYSGEVRVVNIGFPQKAYNQICSNRFILEERDIKRLLPKREVRSNKGTYGKLLVVAGSKNMSGAAYLAAHSAYRTGAGLVKVLTEESNRIILQSILPEAILSTFVEKETSSVRSSKSIQDAITWADGIIIGPGLGQSMKAKELLSEVVSLSKGPILIDGDGLNLLAEDLSIISGCKQPIILTPHPGEMSRLIGLPVASILDQIVEKALSLSKEHKVICVLKDARTIIANDQGDIYINVSGNNGMATAGTGDVLTGIIGALMVQGLKPYDASCLGVFIHGLAGDYGKEKYGTYGLTASDLVQTIPKVLEE